MRKLIGWLVVAAIVIGGGVVAWLYFAGGSGEPSAELTTPTIADGTDSTLGASGDERAFVIDPSRSTATFEIDEELRGSPNHVVGITDEVAGQVVADPSDLSTARFSEILVNARTFETDSGNRDRTIRGPVILNSASDEFEFVSFKVTSTDGLEGSLSPGDTITFTVTGDLTIKGATNPATFDVEMTMSDEDTVEGTTTAQVSRSDYDIGIPSVPSVANVSDEVTIRLDFVAAAA